ncbi:hypothetical protein GCM10027589_33980 [Actinocorallia lasiicapitis]
MGRQLRTVLTAAAVTLTAVTGGGAALAAPGDPTPTLAPGTTGPAVTSGWENAAKVALTQAALKARQQGSAVAQISTVAETGGTKVVLEGTVRATYRPSFAASADYTKVTVNGQEAGPVNAIVDGSGLYVRTPNAPGGGSWMKISSDQIDAASGIDFAGQIGQAADPSVVTRTLAAASGIRADGREGVNGVQTTRYTGRIAVKDALVARLGQPGADKALNQLGDAADDVIAFTVWIDDDGLARKVTTKQTGEVNATSTMTISEYGANIVITPPPADQIGQGPSTAPIAPPTTAPAPTVTETVTVSPSMTTVDPGRGPAAPFSPEPAPSLPGLPPPTS